MPPRPSVLAAVLKSSGSQRNEREVELGERRPVRTDRGPMYHLRRFAFGGGGGSDGGGDSDTTSSSDDAVTVRRPADPNSVDVLWNVNTGTPGGEVVEGVRSINGLNLQMSIFEVDGLRSSGTVRIQKARLFRKQSFDQPHMIVFYMSDSWRPEWGTPAFDKVFVTQLTSQLASLGVRVRRRLVPVIGEQTTWYVSYIFPDDSIDAWDEMVRGNLA